MPKTHSTIMDGTSGTLTGVTFVHSKAYGNHVRSKRGTIKPAPLNSVMQASKERLVKANKPAKLIFDAVRGEHKDGRLWTRLLSAFRSQAKEGLPFSVTCLAELECSREHQLERMLYESQYYITAYKKNDTLTLSVYLRSHPACKKRKNIDGYQVTLVVLFPDFRENSLRRETAHSVIASLKAAPPSFSVEVPAPVGAGEYVVFMKINACEGARPVDVPRLKGMRVVLTQGNA